MGSRSSSISFAVCLSILSGSIGAAFGRRYCGCEPVVWTDERSSSSLGAANEELVRPASPELSGDVMVREAASTAGDVDGKGTSRIAELEAEILRLQSEQGTTRFASMLVGTAPPERPTTLVDVMLLMERSDLTKNEELRPLFLREVRPDMALDLIQSEPKFRTSLAEARRADSYAWPSRREQLLNDFIRRLAEAGLSGRTIEHYRAAIADYL